METITLPYTEGKNELLISENTTRDDVREYMIKDGRLVSSVQLSMSQSSLIAQSMLILNEEHHVMRSLDSEVRQELFQLHGVSSQVVNKFLREYVLCLFQTRTLSVYCSDSREGWVSTNKKKENVTYRRVSLSKTGKELKRVQTLAIRALYALGLDYGVVRCRVLPGRKTIVVNVNVKPKLNQEMEEVFVQATYEYIKYIQRDKVPLKQIVLGADPEFIMQSPKGHLLIASNYFPVKGRVGCDAIWFGQNHANKPLVEIRPDPTPDPRSLAIRIYQGLQVAAKKMLDIPSIWLAGSLPYKGFPLGGHIHFSGIQPNFKMLRALDNYVALFLMIAEDKKGINRRPKYGFLGDFRFQPHGGFEYRTLPSWLISPTLTKGVLALSKVVVANHHLLKCDLLGDVNFQKAYYQGNKERVRVWGHILWEELKNLEEYNEYKTYIDRFFNYVLSTVPWDESKDFRKNWRLPPYDETGNE